MCIIKKCVWCARCVEFWFRNFEKEAFLWWKLNVSLFHSATLDGVTIAPFSNCISFSLLILFHSIEVIVDSSTPSPSEAKSNQRRTSFSFIFYSCPFQIYSLFYTPPVHEEVPRIQLSWSARDSCVFRNRAFAFVLWICLLLLLGEFLVCLRERELIRTCPFARYKRLYETHSLERGRRRRRSERNERRIHPFLLDNRIPWVFPNLAPSNLSSCDVTVDSHCVTSWKSSKKVPWIKERKFCLVLLDHSSLALWARVL